MTFVDLIRDSLLTAGLLLAIGMVWWVGAAHAEEAEASHRIYWDRTLQRVGQPEQLFLRVERPIDAEPWTVTAELVAPDGVAVQGEVVQQSDVWTQPRVLTTVGVGGGAARLVDGPIAYCELAWTVQADHAVDAPMVAKYTLPEGSAEAVLDTDFLPRPEVGPQPYVPEPAPVRGKHHVGGIYFPGWSPGAHYGWSILDAYPERRPALGYYDESLPEVMDWQIKWAVEHGMTFFMFCWYRAHGTEGQPISQHLDHAIHEGFFNARYASEMQFAIMWENGNLAGVSDRDDLERNLFPYWMETYFKHPSYLVIDNKPVLYIYDMNRFIKDLGSEAAVKDATDWMRAAAIEAGFDGLHLIAEYRGDDLGVVERIKACGIDYTFAYCFHTVPENAEEDLAVETLRDTHARRFGRGEILPDVPTIAVGWAPEPWETYVNYHRSPHWWLQPEGYARQARNLRALMDAQPADSLSSRVVMLDNLNEWGEGHYILPHREYGFGYLEAIREVFTDAPEAHVDILPEEVGLGPYDAPHKAWFAEMYERAVAEQGKQD